MAAERGPREAGQGARDDKDQVLRGGDLHPQVQQQGGGNTRRHRQSLVRATLRLAYSEDQHRPQPCSVSIAGVEIVPCCCLNSVYF